MEQKKKNKKQAIALSYDPVDDAPKVIASGTGVLAERIIEKAKEADVPMISLRIPFPNWKSAI